MTACGTAVARQDPPASRNTTTRATLSVDSRAPTFGAARSDVAVPREREGLNVGFDGFEFLRPAALSLAAGITVAAIVGKQVCSLDVLGD